VRGTLNQRARRTMAAAASASSPVVTSPLVRLALPKGRMKEGVFALFEEAGIKVRKGSAPLCTRALCQLCPSDQYWQRPRLPSLGVFRQLRRQAAQGESGDVSLALPDLEVYLEPQPQNILGMLVQGSRDIGFAGYDWVRELELEGEVSEVFDTGLDPVRLVAASPDPEVLTKGVGLGGRKLIVASEYIEITQAWIKEKGLDATFVRTWGATESLPPEDADIIVDNTATGSTLKANGLTIVDTVMRSSTRMYASHHALADPETKTEIDRLVLLLKSVVDARSRKMVTFNLIKDEAALDDVIAKLPCARMPTVSHLYHSGGFAVQIAVATKEIPELLPKIREWGGTDIVVSPIQQLMT
jgi:ATP phosphoribosyltransferase